MAPAGSLELLARAPQPPHREAAMVCGLGAGAQVTRRGLRCASQSHLRVAIEACAAPPATAHGGEMLQSVSSTPGEDVDCQGAQLACSALESAPHPPRPGRGADVVRSRGARRWGREIRRAGRASRGIPPSRSRARSHQGVAGEYSRLAPAIGRLFVKNDLIACVQRPPARARRAARATVRLVGGRSRSRRPLVAATARCFYLELL